MNPRGALALALFLATAAPGTARAVASAELFRTQPERYGRFEARIRYAPGDGVISSFFLWKEGSEMAGVYWNELDFEKLNGDCRMQTNTLYGDPLMSGEQTHTMPSDMCGAYHDYAFEWTPEYIAWFIDSREIRRTTGAVARAFADNTPSGMRVHFNVWPGNADFGGNFSPSILPVHQYISWVQYSAYRDGKFELEWREDFNGAGLPSGWATGDWASPLNLSTHEPSNVSFVDGIAVLSLTADNAKGFNGAPPKDGGGTPTGGASGAGAGGNGGLANAGGQPQASSGAPATGGSAGAPSPMGGGGALSNAGALNTDAGNAGAGNTGANSAGANNAGTSSAGMSSAGASNAGGSGNQPGVGGTAQSLAGSPTTAGQPPIGAEPERAEEDGCGCRVAAAPASRFGLGGAALLAGLMLRRRRSRRG